MFNFVTAHLCLEIVLYCYIFFLHLFFVALCISALSWDESVVSEDDPISPRYAPCIIGLEFWVSTLAPYQLSLNNPIAFFLFTHVLTLPTVQIRYFEEKTTETGIEP